MRPGRLLAQLATQAPLRGQPDFIEKVLNPALQDEALATIFDIVIVSAKQVKAEEVANLALNVWRQARIQIRELLGAAGVSEDVIAGTLGRFEAVMATVKIATTGDTEPAGTTGECSPTESRP